MKVHGWFPIAPLLAMAFASTIAFSASDGDTCSVCNLPVLKDTPKIDNRTTMTKDGKTTAYRCVLCAVMAAKMTKGDVTILAPSDKKGEPVKLIRKAGEWTISPEAAVFACAKGSHAQCQDRYRAVRSREAFEGYAKANARLIAGAKPLTLKELLERVP